MIGRKRISNDELDQMEMTSKLEDEIDCLRTKLANARAALEEMTKFKTAWQEVSHVKDINPIWWSCRNCEHLFKSPVYEPYCPACSGYPTGSYRTWESTIIIAAVLALLCWRFW